MPGMKTAIVCSWLNQYGGAERVLEVVHRMYPEAPVYTSVFHPGALPSTYQSWDIRPSFLNRLPGSRTHHRWFLPLYPFAFEQLDLSEYDLVLSVTSAFAHGVLTSPDTLHICYCLTPARFLWDYAHYAAREELGPLRVFMPLLLYNLRLWDRMAADRVDEFVAISAVVRQRIRKHYRRNAEIIFPPVDVNRIPLSSEKGDYFLIISRLVPYKRIDLAVRAFTALGLRLWIIGEGRDRHALEAMAGPSVHFLGPLSDEETSRHLAGCRAFVLPGEEDFAMAPVEAQAAGRPVIAYAAGGALETVIDGTTGVFFDQPTPESLAEAVGRLDHLDFDPDTIRQNALRFDRESFEERFARLVSSRYQAFRNA